MQKILLCLILLFGASYGYAADDVDDRRIEEQKRKNLKPTESQYFDSSKTDLDPDRDRLDYFEYLENKKKANFSDAVYIACLLSAQSENLTDFESQKKFLNENKILPRSAKKLKQESLVDRGTLAYMIIRILDIRGGLTLHVFRTSKRYAHKELVHEGLMVSGSNKENLTGKELVYTFVKTANFNVGEE